MPISADGPEQAAHRRQRDKMAKKYYLGLDNGTTGTTALLLDENWKQAGKGYKELTQIFPADGWVEQDAEEIWDSVLHAVSAACENAGIQPRQISCLGLDNAGETVVLWDRRSGKPVYNAIVWQDRRTAKYCDSLKEKYGEFVRERTGVMIDPYFSASKIRWILDNVPGAREDAEAGWILAGTLDSWLFWKMTRGKLFITDPSTAGRTLLMNLYTGEWDEGLLGLFGISRKMLPEIHESSELFGYTEPLEFLGARIPVAGGIVDQQSSLFGQACLYPGMVKCTYGTGCFMLMNTGRKPVMSSHGILPTAAWKIGGNMSYALDGGIYVAGAATQWLRDKLGIITSAAETEQMALGAGSNGGVYFVPAFTGLAAPHWDSYARGSILGITGAVDKNHIVRAALEATAYQVRDIFDAMKKDSGMDVAVMRADGGAAVNRFLMQFQSDILGIPIDIPKITETTALGAAYLAAIGTGDAAPDDIAANWKLARTYEPSMSDDMRLELMSKWHKAVERAKNWAE